MKKIVLSLVGLILLVVLIGGAYFWFSPPKNQPTLPAKKSIVEKDTASSADSASPSDESEPMLNVPTIFVHGYSGGKGSFGGMIKRFSQDKEGTPSLVATIDPDASIHYEGEYDFKAKNPLIQVLFSDNKSTEENQSWWLQELFQSLKTNYGIETLNAVGHSMGGVSLTNYITKFGQDVSYPSLDKLVLIGAPINGLEIGADGVTDFDLTDEGPLMATERYQNFMNLRDNLPVDLAVLSIAGDKEDGTKSDGSVSVASALSARFIFEGKVADYREMTFTGLKAAHSLLHENQAVDQSVTQFLWKED